MYMIKKYGILNPYAGCRLLLVCAAALLADGCQSGMDETIDRPFTDNGDLPVTVYFSNAAAQVARVAGNGLPLPLASGTCFRVYAFTQGGEQAASAVYTVGSNSSDSYQTSTGGDDAIKLYRGTYNFYFISDNTTEINQPAAATGNKKVSVGNGKDFICTTLKNVVVQSGSSNSSIVIPVTTPFSHLCSQVSVAVKADSKQPKPITSLTVNSITMKNLSSDRTYELGTTVWSSEDTPTYTGNSTAGEAQWSGAKSSFSANKASDGAFLYESNTPYLALPTDGTVNLEFDVNLTIGYDKTVGGGTTETKKYPVSLSKALLSGTKYRIEFSLTFFGDLAATDIALTVRAYDEKELTTDEIGGDEE